MVPKDLRFSKIFEHGPCLRHLMPGPTPGKVEKESQECTGALTRDRAVLEMSFRMKSRGGGSGFQAGRAGQVRCR